MKKSTLLVLALLFGGVMHVDAQVQKPVDSQETILEKASKQNAKSVCVSATFRRKFKTIEA